MVKINEKMKKKSTVILLATYNGARYLREQIESLYAQTYTDWTIYVHDDGSTDETIHILEDYEARKDNFVVLRYPSQKGASNNFFSLLLNVDADYYFFSDQDDVWMPDKMSQSMARMRDEERDNSKAPILVCCDACVTDCNLSVVSPSLWQQSGTHPEFLTTFAESSASPFVTGCTMLINRKAKESVLWDKKKYATMHDAFITLCVLKANGIVVPMKKSLMYYRQHGDNTLGAFSSENSGLRYKLSHIRTLIKTDYALLRMLHALDYGSLIKFLRYKKIYRKRCLLADSQIMEA